MEFKEALEKSIECKIPLWKAVVANTVKGVFYEASLTDGDFESICSVIYDWVMNTQISVKEITLEVKRCLDKKLFTVDDIRNNYELVLNIIDDRI